MVAVVVALGTASVVEEVVDEGVFRISAFPKKAKGPGLDTLEVEWFWITDWRHSS